jgi:hypothetical protein
MAAWNFSDQEWDALDRLQFSTTDVVCRKREGSLRGLRRDGARPPATTSQASPEERAGKALSEPRKRLSASRPARRPSRPQKRSPGGSLGGVNGARTGIATGQCRCLSRARGSARRCRRTDARNTTV